MSFRGFLDNLGETSLDISSLSEDNSLVHEDLHEPERVRHHDGVSDLLEAFGYPASRESVGECFEFNVLLSRLDLGQSVDVLADEIEDDGDDLRVMRAQVNGPLFRRRGTKFLDDFLEIYTEHTSISDQCMVSKHNVRIVLSLTCWP